MSEHTLSSVFAKFATRFSHWAGQPIAFVGAVGIVLLWAISGPVFGFSETWQLVINTGTTIITFLMVFVLQNSQTRDGRAIQAKLDELILASAAHNIFVGIEHLDEDQIRALTRELEKRAHSLKQTPAQPVDSDPEGKVLRA